MGLEPTDERFGEFIPGWVPGPGPWLESRRHWRYWWRRFLRRQRARFAR
jgi:hypothetical protein